MATVLSDGSLQHSGVNHGRGPMFHPTATWDFLFVETIQPRDAVVLISRDDLPLDWFLRPDFQQKSWYLYWRPSIGHIEDHTVFLTPETRFVQKLEHILDMYFARGNWRAARPIPNPSTMAEAGFEYEIDNDKDDMDSIETKPKRQLRGLGRNWSPYLWEAEMEEHVLRSCQG